MSQAQKIAPIAPTIDERQHLSGDDQTLVTLFQMSNDQNPCVIPLYLAKL